MRRDQSDLEQALEAEQRPEATAQGQAHEAWARNQEKTSIAVGKAGSGHAGPTSHQEMPFADTYQERPDLIFSVEQSQGGCTQDARCVQE
jgi:hypothetical protein